MGFDFFTIHHLAIELDGRLRGGSVTSAGSTEGELGLEIGVQGHLFARLGRDGWVCQCPGPLPTALALPEGAERYLVGARVERVWAAEGERQLWIRLLRPDSSGSPSFGRLVFELIHPHFQVYLTSERSGQVLGRWGAGNRFRLKVGQPYEAPEGHLRMRPEREGVETFANARRAGESLKKSLARLLVGMDEIIADQLLQRVGLAGQVEVTPPELARVWEMAQLMYALEPDPRGYVWTGQRGLEFSGLEPAGVEKEVWPLISQAIHRVKAALVPTVHPGTGEMNARLRSGSQALNRRLKALREDLLEAGAADECGRKGNILLTKLAEVPRGAAAIELADSFDHTGSNRVQIELDPRLTAAENAARYLRYAKKYRQRQAVLPARIAEVERKLVEAKTMLESEGPSREAAEQWLKAQGKGSPAETGGQRGEHLAHPRRYRTSSGWSVWVGRNNHENDLLSHRLAAQNDYWFHAHGYPGAHVVLRREGRKEEPSAVTLREAASVAAYWSKGKTAKKVPVIYTLVKYVSKPRGGAPGQASVKREKTLIVEPALLTEEDER